MPYPYSELPRREVDALGIKTSYYSAGQPARPLVVLLHGMTSSADVYRELMHELADEYWLVAPDIPGFGHSDETEPFVLPHLVEWLASFREALELPEMILVGHSFGGALAASYTIQYGKDVSRLLLVAPAILAADRYPDFIKRLGITLGLADLSGALSQSPQLLRSQSGRAFYDPDSIHESVWPRRMQYAEQSRASGDVLKALAFQDMKPQLRQIHQPVCIIWGENDPVIPSIQAEEIAEELPDSRTIIWNECGHLPFLEKQAFFVAAARAFFQGIEEPSMAVENQRTYPLISVFGGSSPQPASAAYREAYNVGRMLAEHGLAVATGGYIGTMAAVSQGASEAGGHVVGATCDQIEQFRPIGPNQWVQEEIRFQTLEQRLIHLVRNNDGMIVLPGGIGTLAEMALAWSYLQVGEISARPLAFLGGLWRDTVTGFVDPLYVRPDDLQLLFFADTAQEVVEYMANHVLNDKLNG